MGVGILLLPLARTDAERRTFLNSIGPVWDGNEVWLVLGGGVLFAGFPLAYASLFSGLLPGVHARPAGHDPADGRARVPVARRPAPRWRSTLGRGVRGGVARPRAAARRRLRQRRRRACRSTPTGTSRPASSTLLTPFALLVGVTTVAMFAIQGGIYLLIKTEGSCTTGSSEPVPRLMVAFFVLNTLVVVAMVAVPTSRSPSATRTTSGRSIFPAAALVALGGAWLMRPARPGLPGVPVLVGDDRRCCSSRAAIGIYPNLIISTTDPAYDLTITNAASADNTLMVCPDRRAHRHAVRAALHGRRLLHLPGQDRRRLRTATRAAAARMADAGVRHDRTPEGRLLALRARGADAARRRRSPAASRRPPLSSRRRLPRRASSSRTSSSAGATLAAVVAAARSPSRVLARGPGCRCWSAGDGWPSAPPTGSRRGCAPT